MPIETDKPANAPRILAEIDGAVGRLIVDNPARLNAVTLAMWRAIPAAVARLEADPHVRLIIVTGGGAKAFVSGADISEFAAVRRDADSARSYEAANASAFRALRQAKKPTLAAIRGVCLGGGLGLAVACDLRLAAEGSTFGIPAARLGIGYPPECVGDVVAAVGPSRAKEMFFTARRIEASEAARIGLINSVVPAERFDAEIASLAATIAGNAPLTLQAAKSAIDRPLHDPDGSGLAQAVRLADACFESADFAEGRTAFLEKRQPVFRGE
ncbi:MAG: enoyl-CoA hydratase [Ancalomicrobiaceae bacterium]|nr:enoyl-CoA hydratase [Ancalomicrobiaceae bacterium]